MTETSEELQAVVGKTIAAVKPIVNRHWDGGPVEDGLTLEFTDGSSADLQGFSAQSHGYIDATVHPAQ